MIWLYSDYILTRGGQGGWSSRTFDLLLYMIIDLKRSINLKWLLMSSAIFISDNLVASAAGNHQKLSLILLHQSSFHSDVWCGQNSSSYHAIPIARKNSDQFWLSHHPLPPAPPAMQWWPQTHNDWKSELCSSSGKAKVCNAGKINLSLVWLKMQI